jgi:surface protein
MFQECTSLEILNLSNWDISEIDDPNQIAYMLDGCTSLHTLRLDHCNEETINRIIMSDGFPTDTPTTGSGEGELRLLYCEERNAANIQLPVGWKFVYVMPLYRPFEFRDNTNIIEVETIVNKSHTYLDMMFYGCIALKSINSTEWDTSNVTNMNYMFFNCNSLESLDLNNWNTSKVTDMSSMFDMHHIYTYDRSSLTSLIINEWDTSNVTNMNYMFSHCDSLESLDLNNWNTSKVTDMSNMFSNCESLESLNINNWDINCVTDMSHMFFNCSSLTNLDLSNWKNIKNKTDMSHMFYKCSALRELDLSNWNTIGMMWNVFSDCNNLEILHLDNWDKDMIEEIIRRYGINPPNLPTGTINGTTRKIYCKKANTAGLIAPDGWKFVYVD